MAHVWTNQNLFSQKYLEARLPETGLWHQQQVSAAQAREAIRAAFSALQDLQPGSGEEASLEQWLIRPVFDALGFTYDVQPVTRAAGRVRRPDYALFPSAMALADARQHRDHLSQYYRHALAIADAKYWDRPLGAPDPRDTDSRDPTAKMVRDLDDAYYLSGGGVNWAVLTNGKRWRLFSYRAPSRATLLRGRSGNGRGGRIARTILVLLSVLCQGCIRT